MTNAIRGSKHFSLAAPLLLCLYVMFCFPSAETANPCKHNHRDRRAIHHINCDFPPLRTVVGYTDVHGIRVDHRVENVLHALANDAGWRNKGSERWWAFIAILCFNEIHQGKELLVQGESKRYYPFFCMRLDIACVSHDETTAAPALHSLGLGNVFPTSELSFLAKWPCLLLLLLDRRRKLASRVFVCPNLECLLMRSHSA